MSEKNDQKIQLGRRDFLKASLGLTLGGMLAWPDLAQAENKELSYRVSGWFGNQYDLAHQFRDGYEPSEPTSFEKKEVVVVGAGLSGLIAAYKLRDMDTLVLEYEEQTGGNAKSLLWEGNAFNIGSAYYAEVDGPLGKLLQEIGVKPQQIPEPTDVWKMKNGWVSGPWSEETMGQMPEKLQKSMQSLKKALTEITEGEDGPQIPYHTSSSKSLTLDTISFAEWLKPYMTEEVKAFIDAYCYSAAGAPSDTISAFAGIYQYSEILAPIYSTSAGNSTVAQALTKAIEAAGANRIRTSAYVYRIRQKGDKVVVYYIANGQAHAVEANDVVLAIPYFVAARVIEGLAQEQETLLTYPKYSSYIVANLRFDQVVTFQGYDNWVPCIETFQDFIPVGWPEQKRNLAPNGECQILTCFAPYVNYSLGRQLMLKQPKEMLAECLANQVEQIFPGAKKHLKEVYLTRWGHAMVRNEVNMITRWLPRVQKKIGSIYLAHTDGQTISTVETALPDAIWATEEIRAHKKG
jgi:protoporphyrinogen oxidase